MALSALVSYDDIWRHIVSFLPPIRNPTPRYIANYLQVALKYKRYGVLFVWNALPPDFIPNYSTYRSMIRDGCLDGVKWLQNLKIPVGGDSLTRLAAEYEQLECLKYVWNDDIQNSRCWVISATCRRRVDCLRWITEQFRLANILPQDIDDGCVCIIATKNNNLECLKYAHFNGYLWSSMVCSSAANNGNLECLKFAHTHGCPWDERVYINAIQQKHFDCIEYAFENKCPWSEVVALSAVRSPAEYFKYIIDNGCPHGFRTTIEVVVADRADLLDYLMERGAELDDRICQSIVAHLSFKCNDYAHKYGKDPLGATYEYHSLTLDVRKKLSIADPPRHISEFMEFPYNYDDSDYTDEQLNSFRANEACELQSILQREALRGIRKENGTITFAEPESILPTSFIEEVDTDELRESLIKYLMERGDDLPIDDTAHWQIEPYNRLRQQPTATLYSTAMQFIRRVGANIVAFARNHIARH